MISGYFHAEPGCQTEGAKTTTTAACISAGYLLLGNWSKGNYRMDHNVYWDTTTDGPDFHDPSSVDWQAPGHSPASR